MPQVILEFEVFNYFKKNREVKESDFLDFLVKRFSYSKGKAWYLSKILQRPFFQRQGSKEGQFYLPMIEESGIRNSVSFKRMLRLTEHWQEKNENEAREIFDKLLVITPIEY